MDIWQMRYFIQVYNDRSLTQAAKELFISQQGLSKTIKNIEDEFQITLFERTSKGVIPTNSAELLIENSKQIVNYYDEMVTELNQKKKCETEKISIGIANILYNEYFSSIMHNFHDEYPNISLEYFELGTYACKKYLENNIADVCFTVRPNASPTYDFIPVAVFDMVLLTNKQNPLSQKFDINIKELKNEHFIMLSSEYKIRKLTIDFCERSGFYPIIFITTSQLDFIIEYLDRNKGVAILPEFNSIKALKRSNKIATLKFKDNPFKIEVGFMVHKCRNIKCIKTLIDYALALK